MSDSILTKYEKRKIKAGVNTSNLISGTDPIDCACVIHGDAYNWIYVDRLYNMLNRHLTPGARLHVYTEADRPVSDPYIKHSLLDWGIGGPKQSWWYKMQLFNAEHFRGPLLYFDLDTVITGNIDWIWQLNLQHFWTVRDFKYLWRPTHNGSNSSVMWWNTAQYDYIWKEVQNRKIEDLVRRYHGDQDFISEVIPLSYRRFFNTNWVKSWRWECLDGGFNFKKRKHNSPNTGTHIDENTSILVFHGNPKPYEIVDPVVNQYWQ